MCELAHSLANHTGAGYVVAPAGFGKTYLIAQAALLGTGRQLILTHTYAGVNALRHKMRALGVSNQHFHIDTIASWSLRICLSYANTSGWNTVRPADNAQWNALYDACARLLDCVFMHRIIRASYTGLYVDEYQDCSTTQHAIILKLARHLPCCILGDPLQGIFDFGEQNSVDWTRDVEGNFESLGALDVPHRWIQAGAGDLGVWLTAVRTNLEQGQDIDLGADLPNGVRFVQASTAPQEFLRAQGNTCRYFNCDALHTVIAIHKGSQKYKAKCHTLSRNLSGRYSSIEEVEGKDLFAFLRRFDAADTRAESLKEIVSFAGKCMTAVNTNLAAGTSRGEHVDIRGNTRNPQAAQKANEYLANPTSAAMAGFLLAIKETPATSVIRADLLNRALGVLRKNIMHPELSLTEAAEKYHGEFRYKGRPVGHRKLIGTTLLVKGLEFDHAIVLDAKSLSKKEIYVALTRGSRSLTIISDNPTLNPIE